MTYYVHLNDHGIMQVHVFKLQRRCYGEYEDASLADAYCNGYNGILPESA